MERQLTLRQHKILRATVRSYVETAEPVGSKALAEQYDLGVSSATIRNDLATLEQEGLLFQPYTSAGRIPSDSGYRVYVNALLDSQILPWAEPQVKHHPIRQQVLDELGQQGNDLDDLLARVARILAKLSGCIALITLPQPSLAVIRHVQLLMVAPDRLMVILVTNSYQTQSIVVNLSENTFDEIDPPTLPLTSVISPEELSQELQLLSNFLNFKLRGTTVQELHDLSWLELDQDFQSYANWLRHLFKAVAKKCLNPAVNLFYTSGMSELMRQPEFAEAQKVQSVMQLLEEDQAELSQILWLDQPGAMAVYIGTENSLETIHHCSLITASYSQNQASLGAVSLLGPTRMAYDRSIVAVQTITDYLSNTLTSSGTP